MKSTTAAIAIASTLILGSETGFYWVDEFGKKIKTDKDPKFPFDEFEIEKLSSLKGKEKKNYLKELKSKYLVSRSPNRSEKI